MFLVPVGGMKHDLIQGYYLNQEAYLIKIYIFAGLVA